MEIGQQVKVRRVRQRIPGNIISRVKQNPIGTIKDFKMVDGSGIGFWVQFEENLGTWFFEDELEPIS